MLQTMPTPAGPFITTQPPAQPRNVLAYSPTWKGPATALIVGIAHYSADGRAVIHVVAFPNPEFNGHSESKNLLNIPLYGPLTPNQRGSLPDTVKNSGWCEWPAFVGVQRPMAPPPAPARAMPMPAPAGPIPVLSVEQTALATHDGKPFHQLSIDAQRASTRRVARVLHDVRATLAFHGIRVSVRDEYDPPLPAIKPPEGVRPNPSTDASASVPGREPSRAEMLESGALSPGDGDKPAAPVAASGDRIEDL